MKKLELTPDEVEFLLRMMMSSLEQSSIVILDYVRSIEKNCEDFKIDTAGRPLGELIVEIEKRKAAR